MMRNIKIFAALAVLIFTLIPVSAMAQTSIAVVDVDRILQEAKAAKSLQKKRNDAREKFLSELSTKEQDLRKKSQELYDKRKDLSEDEFVKERQAYEAQLLEVRKLAQTKKRAFEEASAESLGALRNALTSVVQKIAAEKGYSLVISARDVIAGEKELEITEEALKQMNKDISDIPFKIKN